ncbi:MAG: thiamine biosynthesis protein ThiS [Spirochaetes bacterium GWF1_41_5]|nr:MAG: thiamine biosynthesis protein ThiS [Spirochaetes bacterium GWF1_41_5]
MKDIIINGQKQQTGCENVSGLLTEMNLDAETVAVEINGVVLKKSSWQKTPVNSNDRIEIVSFVGGG